MKPQCNNVALVCNFSLGEMFGGNPVLRYLSILNLKHMFVFFVLVDEYAKYAVGKYAVCEAPFRLRSWLQASIRWEQLVGLAGLATCDCEWHGNMFQWFSMFGFTSSMLNCGVEKGNSHQNVLLV